MRQETRSFPLRSPACPRIRWSTFPNSSRLTETPSLSGSENFRAPSSPSSFPASTSSWIVALDDRRPTPSCGRRGHRFAQPTQLIWNDPSRVLWRGDVRLVGPYRQLRMQKETSGRGRAESTVIKLIFEGWSVDVPHSLSCVGSYLGLGIAGWLPHNVTEGSPFRAALGRSRSSASVGVETGVLFASLPPPSSRRRGQGRLGRRVRERTLDPAEQRRTLRTASNGDWLVMPLSRASLSPRGDRSPRRNRRARARPQSPLCRTAFGGR